MKTQSGYRYGYIDLAGKQLLAPEYNDLYRITEIDEQARYLIAYKNGQAGVLKDEKIFIEHNYQAIEYDANNHFFKVTQGTKTGVMDFDKKLILPIEYDDLIINPSYILAQQGYKQMVFDTKGNKIENPKFMYKTPTEDPNVWIAQKITDATYCIIDKEENILVEGNYSYIDDAFGQYFIVYQDEKCGLVSCQDGKVILEPVYNHIQKIMDYPLLEVYKEDESSVEYYGKDMEKLVTASYPIVEIKDNFIEVYEDNNTYYFDFEGNMIGNEQAYKNNPIISIKQDGKYGFKNKEGKIVVPAIYDRVTELNQFGYAGIKKDGKWGVINKNGEIILEPLYELQSNRPEFLNIYYKQETEFGSFYTDLIEG